MLPSLLILLRHCLPSLADERIRKVMATYLIYQRFSLLALVLHAAVDVLSSVVGNVSDIVQRSQQIAVDFVGGGHIHLKKHCPRSSVASPANQLIFFRKQKITR